MVTNINLVAPDVESKSPLTGKSALALSVLLVVIVACAYGAISYLNNSYARQNDELEKTINSEKKKLTGENYSDLFDFQERLVLLDKIVADHSYWDVFLKDFSRYVIPEVTLTKLSYNEKGGILEISGFATNYESLSKELMLLRSYPGAKSVEFKNTAEEPIGEDGQGGASLNVEIKLDKAVLKK